MSGKKISTKHIMNCECAGTTIPQKRLVLESHELRLSDKEEQRLTMATETTVAMYSDDENYHTDCHEEQA